MKKSNNDEQEIGSFRDLIYRMRSHFSIPTTIRLYVIIVISSSALILTTNRFDTELVWVNTTGIILAFHDYLSHQSNATMSALAEGFPRYFSWAGTSLSQDTLLVIANVLLAFPMLAYEQSSLYTFLVMILLVFLAFIWALGTYMHALFVESELNKEFIKDEIGGSVLERNPHRLATISIVLSLVLLFLILTRLESWVFLRSSPLMLLHYSILFVVFPLIMVLLLCPISVFPSIPPYKLVYWELIAAMWSLCVLPEYVWLHENFLTSFSRVICTAISLILLVAAYVFYSPVGLLGVDTPFTMRITAAASWILIAILILLQQISEVRVEDDVSYL